jgi:hypothetical protein
MSEGQHLLVILVALYLSDCFFWLHHHSAVLVKSLRRGWEMRSVGRLLINQNGRAVFLNPLPLLAPAFQVEAASLICSPQGLLAWISQAAIASGRPPQRGTFIPWAEVKKVEAEDDYLCVNGARFVCCHSKGRAANLCDQVRHLLTLQVDQRAAAICNDLQQELDEAAVGERVAFATKSAASAQFFGRTLFLFMFVGAPLVSWHYGLLRTIVPLAALLFGCVVITTVMYCLGHRKLYPGRIGERVGHSLIMCFSWPMAVRASDAVTRHALEGFHPMAVARHLMRPEKFESYAQAFLRDLYHPLQFDHLEAAAQEAVRWQLALERVVIGDWLGDACNLSEPVLGECDKSYCPRCLTPYTLSEGDCASCPGVSLLRSSC